MSRLRQLLLVWGVMVFGVGAGLAQAQTTCYFWSDTFGGLYSSAAQAAQSWCSHRNTPSWSVICSSHTTATANETITYTVSAASCPGDTAPVQGQPAILCTWTWTEHDCFASGSCAPDSNGTTTDSVSVTSGNCNSTNPCAAKVGQEAFVGGAAPVTGDVCDGSCVVSTSQPTTVIRGNGAASGPTIYRSAYTGAQCSSRTSGETVGAQCASAGGAISCGTSGKNCGTFNGDQVCVSSIPPGTCQSFSSGGVACTAVGGVAASVGTPPAPNNGTAGTPATSTGSVTTTVSSTTETTNYYNSSTVASSTTTVVSNPGGTNTGNGGTTGSGTGTTASDGKGNAGTSCGNGKTSSGADCVNDGFTGGTTCDVPPSCTGDAIQCAQAQQEFLTRCQDPVTLADVFPSGSTNANQLNDTTQGGDVSQMLDQTAFLSGSCLPDRTIDLGNWGHIVLPLSQFCWVFQAFGYMTLACAWIGAAKIVVGVNQA